MTDTTPFFSIVVPTLNRPRQLDVCLAALARLDYPTARFEVIVIDDGSEPPVTAGDTDLLEGRLTWLHQSNAGPAAARNAGVGRARGDYLAFTDDDCVPDPGWLTAFARACSTAPRALLGGRTTNALPENIYATASQRIVDAARIHFAVTRAEFRFFASNNLAMRADLFRALKGFDPEFRTSEDRDLCARGATAGHALVYVPDAVVRHRATLTLGGFWHQHFGYGRGAFRFHRARARRGAGRFRPELPFYWRAFRMLASRPREGRATSPAAPFVVWLFFVWQVANAAGFVWQGWRGDTPGEPT